MTLHDVQEAATTIAVFMINFYFIIVFASTKERRDRILAAIGILLVMIAFKICFGAK